MQGVTVSQTSFTGGLIGIWVGPETVTSESLTELTIVGCQFNTSNDQILINFPLGSLLVSTTIFYVPSNYAGIAIAGSGVIAASSIIGNAFSALPSTTATQGISANGSSTSSNVIITANTFYNLTTGVNLSSTTSGFNVQANSYASVSTKVANSGTGNSIGIATD